jgi:imidazole glycerol-phosphate synthase subunit HisH
VTVSAPSVVVVDYGSGNLHSAQRALAHVGADVEVSSDPQAAESADGAVIPGVGAFGTCIAGVRRVGADRVARSRVAAGRPVLGICVGMQILYDAGTEHDERVAGLGLLPGEVLGLQASVLPHIGWNTVHPPEGSTLFHGIAGERFYFVHSYAARPSGDGETITVHDAPFVAAVEIGALSATQFHPEKSGDAGLALLRNWVSSLS